MKKIHLAVACAATFMVAGVTSDAFAKGSAGRGFSTSNGQFVSLNSATPRPAGVAPVCISPVGRTANSDAFLGDPSNSVVTLNIGVGNQLLGVAADASVTAHSPSWLSESAVMFSSSELDDPDAIYLTVSDTGSSGTETVSTAGVLLFGDFALPPIPVDADGILRLEWHETYDDESVDPDSTWADSAAPATCSGIYLVCTDQAACDNAVSGGPVVPPDPPVPYSYLPVPTLSQWTLGLLATTLGFLAFRSRRFSGKRS